MIRDKQMFDLGFKKLKTYKKKVNGISSFCWERTGFMLDIIKNDNDEFFSPTLEIGFHIYVFYDIEHLKRVLDALNSK